MGMIDLQYRTVTCNGPECKNTTTFQLSKEEHQKALAAPGNEWLKSTRILNTPDGRVLVYCSDTCEAKGVATGSHNLPEPKRIIDGVASAAQVQAAADAARAAEEATKAIREGRPTQVSIG